MAESLPGVLRTVAPHSYTPLFAFGLAFAAADAFGIGSNDVANSFATSVGSRSLSLRAACVIASVTELFGAAVLGGTVTAGIKDGIIGTDRFAGQVDVLMLAMLCSLVGSSFWVNMASRLGLAVSTSHAIVGAIMGVGYSFGGSSSIQWGSFSDPGHGGMPTGVKKIILSWFISPVLAAALSTALFLLTRYLVLLQPDSHARMLALYPAYVSVTFCVVLFFIVLQTIGHFDHSALRTTASGGKVLTSQAVGSVVGVTFALTLCVYAAAHFGRSTPAFAKYIDSLPLGDEPHGSAKGGAAAEAGEGEEEGKALLSPASPAAEEAAAADVEADDGGIFDKMRAFAFSGLEQDVLTPTGVGSEAAQRAHDLAQRYDPHTERLFSAVQVFTASFASLAHGSNDVANAVAPLSIISHYWSVGSSDYPAKFSTPFWCLLYGGLWIDIGLLLCGYRVMRSLGNNITYHSPSRGYCMELGALTTVLIASALGVPVSTTHCITGATVGVGLCTGSLEGINWRMVAVTFLGWIITLPGAGLVAGLTFSLIAHSPKALPTTHRCPDTAPTCNAASRLWQPLPQDWCAAGNFSAFYDAAAYSLRFNLSQASPLLLP